MDEAATDGPFVSAPAWPALPRFLAPFLEVLDDKARPRREPTRRSLMQYGVASDVVPTVATETATRVRRKNRPIAAKPAKSLSGPNITFGKGSVR
jgi:hypothetical protein